MDEVIRIGRVKLFANALHIVASGLMVAAVATEPFALANNASLNPLSALPFILMSFVLSCIFHTIAQVALGRLSQ